MRLREFAQVTPGTGVATSGCTRFSSYCLACLRDRCAGPAAITTTIAAAQYTAACSHHSLVSSAPENIEKNVPPMALTEPWNSIVSSTLPFVLLYTHVNRIAPAMANSTNGTGRKEDRQVPEGPDYPENEAGDQRGSSGLQPRQGIATPARLLPQRTIENEQEGEHREEAEPLT